MRDKLRRMLAYAWVHKGHKRYFMLGCIIGWFALKLWAAYTPTQQDDTLAADFQNLVVKVISVSSNSDLNEEGDDIG